jgi:hypothetical protein
MALDFSCQVQRHPLTDRGSDCYDTPPEAVRALLEAEHLPNRIWEPCVGRGAVADVLKAAGHEVVGTDLHDYGIGYPGGIDFLMEHAAPPGVDTIVTNPPFMLAQQFVEKALELVPRTFFLLRLAFFESQRRTHILENVGLARIYVFRRRLPFMHRAGWQGPKNSNSGMAFGWYCWDRAHTGPTTIHRIDWSEYPAGALPAASSGVALKGALRSPAGDSTLAVKDADRSTSTRENEDDRS